MREIFDQNKHLVFHIIIFIVSYLSLWYLGLFDNLPAESNLRKWDIGWYYTIATEGYSYYEDAQSTAGFFPLFAYVWKLTGLGFLGIGVFNTVPFAAHQG